MIEATAPEDEALLLDLLNSTPLVGGVVRDLLDDDPSWFQIRGSAGTRAEVVHLRRVRDRLQAVVRGTRGSDALVPFLTDVRLLPEVARSGLTWRLDARDDELLAARALWAWGRVQELAPGRLRPCTNEECRLFLLDRSKPNKARWCSMRACGNRLKARRHYERTRRDQ